MREVIRDGENGLLVPFGEPDRLAERTVRLLDDPRLAGDLATSARKSAVERFDLKRVSLPKHLALLDAVARGEPPVSDRGIPTNQSHAKHEQE